MQSLAPAYARQQALSTRWSARLRTLAILLFIRTSCHGRIMAGSSRWITNRTLIFFQIELANHEKTNTNEALIVLISE